MNEKEKETFYQKWYKLKHKPEVLEEKADDLIFSYKEVTLLAVTTKKKTQHDINVAYEKILLFFAKHFQNMVIPALIQVDMKNYLQETERIHSYVKDLIALKKIKGVFIK